MKTKTIGRIMFLIGAAILALPAYGQDQERGVLEEIIVTAEKRTANLQDVPVAITAFSSETREEIGILSVQDLTNFTPGLTYSTNLDRITLRGIGRFTNNLASDPGVAVYSDNFYTSSTVEAGISPLFIDRNEVLRGPQGTLYGRNSIGGAINVIAKRPTEEFSAEVRTSLGDYDRSEVGMLLRGPIHENVRYLIGASATKQKEGFFTNVNGGPSEGGVIDDQFYTAQLDMNFGDLDIWLKYQRGTWEQSRRSTTRPSPYDTDFGLNGLGQGTALLPTGSLVPTSLYNTGVGFLPASVVPPNGLSVPLFPAAQPFTATNPGVTNNREFRTNTPFKATLDENDIFVVDMKYHFENVDVRYTGGYQHYLYNQVSDFDGTDRDFYDYTDPFTFVTARVFTSIIQDYTEDKEWMSHEINISSTHSGDLQWLVGLYNYHEEYEQPLYIASPDQANLETPCISFDFASCSGLPTAPNPNRAVYSAETDMKGNDSNAIYGQIDWAFAPEWSTTIGLRYTKDEKDLTESHRVVRWDPTFDGAAVVTDITRLLTANNDVTRNLQNEWDAVTGTLGVQWTPTDDSLAFAKYTRGYKSGGFNSGTINATPSVDEEEIDALEFGLKTTLMDALQINTAFFYYDYQNFQSNVSVVPAGGGPTRSEFLNLDEASSMGLEIETTWAATDALTVLFNYSWQKSEIEDIGRLILDTTDPTAAGPNANPALTLAQLDPVTGSPRVLQDVSGNPLPGSPENKIAINLRYSIELSPGELVLSLSDTWRDEANFSLFNDPGSTADSYNQVDFRVLWLDYADKYTVIGYVQNLLDDDGFDGVIDSRADDGSIYSTGSLTAPRTYGVEFQYRFGE